MSENRDRTVQIKDWQMDYLGKMAEKYDLEDESKALRCLISFAHEEEAHEASIFGEFRCFDC